MRGLLPSPSCIRLVTPAAILLLALPAALPAESFAPQTATQTATPGCTLSAEVYHCDLNNLQRALARAHSVAIETQAMDRQTAAQLRELVTELGKEPASTDRPANLIFLLTPVEGSGIHYGPSDHELATLRVYSADPQGGRDALLWAETLHGQGDRPWPTQVHTLIEQFRDQLKSK